jgi:hypothetical protein
MRNIQNKFRISYLCRHPRHFLYCFGNIGESKLRNSALLSLSELPEGENGNCGDHPPPNPAISFTTAGEISDSGDLSPPNGDNKCGVVGTPDSLIGVIASGAASSNLGGFGTSSAECGFTIASLPF